MNSQLFETYLPEFMWRRKFGKQKAFSNFLSHIKEQQYLHGSTYRVTNLFLIPCDQSLYSVLITFHAISSAVYLMPPGGISQADIDRAVANTKRQVQTEFIKVLSCLHPVHVNPSLV